MKEVATPDATPGSLKDSPRTVAKNGRPKAAADPSDKAGGGAGQAARKRREKPAKQPKPWADFPLFWHCRGYWCVKRDGRQIAYTADWKESYDRYTKDEEARAKGQTAPSLMARGHELHEAVVLFLRRQRQRYDDGEISDVQLAKYRAELERFEELMGGTLRLTRLCTEESPKLFRKVREAAIERGLVVAERHIYYVKACLEMAAKRGLMPPAYYGDSFEKPTAEQRARHKLKLEQEHGERAWSAAELRAIVQGAYRKGEHLLAQVLLGLNVGFGADDCALLRDRMLDRELRLIKDAYRGKTLRKRVCPMWPITLWAIDRSRSIRMNNPRDKKDADRVFLTENGFPVARKLTTLDEKGRVLRTSRVDAVNLAYRRMIRKLEEKSARFASQKDPHPPLKLRKYRAGFYTLRAMFRTLAVGCGVDNDLIAVIKGQKFARAVDEYYLRGDLRAKLFGVVEHVYWELFGGWAIAAPWSLWPRQINE
jgi:hypothetical protein